MLNNWLFLPLALGSLTLSGCDLDMAAWGSSDRYKEDFSYQAKLASGGRLVLETFNGSVEVTGWDRDEVDISGTKNASREEVVKEMKVDVITEPGSVRIRVLRPVERNCNCGARVVLKVPRKVILDNIVTSNASVRVESIDGNARLKSSNGSINVYGVNGDVEAETSNASIDVNRFKGAASLRTSNGRIKAEGVEGAFDARTSNSSIEATLARLESGRTLTLESSNGSINATLETWNNNAIHATTSNSSINLTLPESVHGDLKASTSNGNISTDFSVTSNQFSKTRLNGQVNGGGPVLELTTSNGNIRLMKR